MLYCTFAVVIKTQTTECNAFVHTAVRFNSVLLVSILCPSLRNQPNGCLTAASLFFFLFYREVYVAGTSTDEEAGTFIMSTHKPTKYP